MTPMFYDRLEVKKLILAVDDISLLESIYNENLKKLLGNNLKTFEERFKIILAFEVRDVL